MPTKPPVNHLEFGLFGHARQLVTLEECADKFVVNPQQIRRWVQEGWLLKVSIGTAEGKGDRDHYRIQRFSAEAFFIFRTEEGNGGICPPYKLSADAEWWLEKCREHSNNMGKKQNG